MNQHQPHLGCSSNLDGGGSGGGGRRGHVDRAEFLFVEGRLQALGQIRLVSLHVQASLGQLGLQLGNLFVQFVKQRGITRDEEASVMSLGAEATQQQRRRLYAITAVVYTGVVVVFTRRQ